MLYKMRRFQQAESPVVEKSQYKKKCARGSRLSLTWGTFNLCLATVMYLELSYGPVFDGLTSIRPILWYIEFGLAILFTANFLWHTLAYLYWSFPGYLVIITPLQRKLLGIAESEQGFRDPAVLAQRTSITTVQTPPFSPSSFTTSRGTLSGILTPITPAANISFSSQHNNLSFYQSYSPISPLPPTPPHGHRTPSPGGSPHGSSHSGSGSVGKSGSFIGASGLFDSSQNAYMTGLNASKSFLGSGGASPLSATNTLSPLFRDSDATGLRARLSGAGLKASPMRSDDCITDQKALDQFLLDQQDKELRRQSVTTDPGSGSGNSFWSYNRSFSDYTPVLRKYQYQIACRSPQQTKAKDDDTDEPASYLADEVWTMQNVQLHNVDRWIENLRKWLSNTILSHLLQEINKVNDVLARIGCEDMQIGEVSISTLKQLATTKRAHVPTLNSVVPFLEACSNQEYLVKRIQELGSTGCMSDFKWNGGGSYKDKPWGEHLPTDSVILMHLLCSYMDARLPPHPKYPDGKTFTTHYFMRTPDKPDLKKDHVLLYQSKVNPPHFKVFLEDDVLNPQKGRNNLFHALLLFIYHLKVKNHGMLGRINLGMSGVNLLWVID